MAGRSTMKNCSNDIVEGMKRLEKELIATLAPLQTDSFRIKTKTVENRVEYIYNPLEYAFDLHCQYLEKYCNSQKKVIFLGMNPGPFGMVQTGVPFGEIDAVRNFLKIEGKVNQPATFHPKRPIEGLNCRRSEVSGNRLWGLFQDLCNDNPDIFFKHSFVHNYFPLALVSKSGLNVTPADLKLDDQITINSICDENLAKVIKLLEAEIIVGIGRFAEKRAEETVKQYSLDIKVLEIPHPSPRSKGSANWVENTKLLLQDLDLMKYIH